ncbi:Mitochondrial-processing peptidase subunit alpha [Phytophthora megakarya]|uniref:Mitochondrial-processing peptidase subunit alpha n=1 Tax=Phytophthora megakarya TaxID=4795 RepID=A0A225VJA5_9STRA|nr:Mitochondrial-processing peptidase subunit alpha [Phytophthora megakarya]
MLASSSSKLAARASRSLFTKASAMPSVALSEEFPAVPQTQPQAAAAPKFTSSTASSARRRLACRKGLTLGSDDRAASVATIGVQLNTGARDESEETAGVSQLFAKMAFRATQSRSDLRLYRDIEAIGGVVNAQAGRDFVRYSVSVLPDQLEAAAAILAETTLAPKFALYDVDDQKKVVQAEFEKITGDASASLLEGVHAAAFYDDVTLGRSLVAAENLNALSPEDLWAYYDKYVNTSNAALVGAGVAHSTLTDLANTYFGDVVKGSKASSASAKYVGGETRVKQAGKFTHVALALPTVGRDSADFGASQVLRALLNVRLNNKKASAFLSSYSDVALVGLSGYAAHSEAGALVDSFAAELKKAASAPATKEELAAAKTTAALEAFEQYNTLSHVGLITTGFASKSPSELVEGVTAAKLQELAQKAVKATPSVAAIGKLSAVPHVDAVASKLQ